MNVAEESEYKQKFGWRDDIKYSFKARKGLDEQLVREISMIKGEPEWMLEKRLLGYRIFKEKPNPTWGADLSGIDYDNIYYYAKPTDKKANSWDEIPKEIKETFDKLGVPEAEQKFFAGTEAQYDSEVVYSHVKEEFNKLGVIFVSTDEALKKYPELFKKYFGTVIPPSDNKFAALNTAVWSGGSFIYVPKGVKLSIPLQAYFRINAENIGQFERTLIIADEGSDVTYIEGCTAPIYLSSSLHAAVVEIVALKGAHVRYITIQNWSKNVYNLVTQRAHVYDNAFVEWIDANIGSKVNMKYPSVVLKGEGAKGSVLSVAVAGDSQFLDSGGKAYHLAKNTTSQIISKSVSSGSGTTNYRGLVYIGKDAENSKTSVKCDALLVDNDSKTATFPYIEAKNSTSTITHEATTGKISEDMIYYLQSRGISEDDARTLIVLGFIEELEKELPLEYLLELKRLIKLNMEHAVG